MRHCLDGLATTLALIHQKRCLIQPALSYPRPPRKAKPHCYFAYKLA
ncbi:hypothetical protein C7412_1288 [Paraburkholderia silvatlantica]|nr:hypothetical protein C7412_1288 [Paraburkholderia silvatlantica]